MSNAFSVPPGTPWFEYQTAVKPEPIVPHSVSTKLIALEERLNSAFAKIKDLELKEEESTEMIEYLKAVINGEV